ncbi:lipopolysaccharide biosynthesis protein [Geobacter sp.]|uniref:lipopolysaccharide biosynthesis protein n=1 Tax=Geobacter sp. TaxID=46610 RepID=UPI0027BA0533|nr:hypothetical protein [Geobacter sp.]
MRFLSMFIVMPYLTKNPTVYGIYALCISVTIFLSYADLGFLKASQKYAAECFIREDRYGEIEYIGFGTFVLFVFSMLCAGAFFLLSCYPDLVIKGLDTPDKISTASSLLMTLALFTPGTVLQRMVSIIFDIRLETHVYQRISFCASIITILSVFYFFGSSRYLIVPYFLFSQVINLLSVFVCLGLARNRYRYDLKQLFRSIRFNAGVYRKVNRLAYSGLYVMIVWIAFYEFDQLTIAKLLGAEKLAIYAIAFSFATLFRSIYGIVFSPFAVRANHFVGTGDDEGLKTYCQQLVLLTAPVVVFPTVAFALVAKPFVVSWVGEPYLESVNLARCLTLIYALSFISYTTSTVLMSKERIREIYVIATILPIVFWLGVLTTYSRFGLLSFAAFKLLATLLSEAFYLYALLKYLRISLVDFFATIIRPLILPLLFLGMLTASFYQYLPSDKSKVNVIIVIATTAASVVCTFLLHYLTASQFRTVTSQLLREISAGSFGLAGLRKKITSVLGF